MAEPNESQATELLEFAEQLQARGEQLQAVNSQLSAANENWREQVRQYAEPLIVYGEGVHRVVINGRSIRALSLRQLIEADSHGATRHTGTYCLMIDDLQVTPYLSPEQAEQELDQAQKVWTQALQPPD